jgi:hypothetical protein
MQAGLDLTGDAAGNHVDLVARRPDSPNVRSGTEVLTDGDPYCPFASGHRLEDRLGAWGLGPLAQRAAGIPRTDYLRGLSMRMAHRRRGVDKHRVARPPDLISRVRRHRIIAARSRTCSP